MTLTAHQRHQQPHQQVYRQTVRRALADHRDHYGAQHGIAAVHGPGAWAHTGYVDDLVDLFDHADRPCPGRHPADAIPLGTPAWCTACTERITRALSGPLSIADLLALATGAGDGQLLEVTRVSLRVTASREPASPSPAIDEVDDVHRWAVAWAEYLATHLGRASSATDRDDPLSSRGLPDLANALGYLNRWLRPALTSPFAHEFGEAVLWVHRHLQRAAGEQPQRRMLRVPCPACQAIALVREDGGIGTRRHEHDTEQIEVECTFCGAAWTDPAFQAALEEAS